MGKGGTKRDQEGTKGGDSQKRRGKGRTARWHGSFPRSATRQPKKRRQTLSIGTGMWVDRRGKQIMIKIELLGC